ncbi:MAG TPA: YchJ family metal-binding protein [Gammaproteobacteria bacterium]|nr:YchJ family metal-binding protein [Gammaproteobacteria bacterium]
MNQAECCPCGSGRAMAECCGPALSGQCLPDTAEALMRSRFTAFVRGDVEYLLTTWHPRTRPMMLDLTDQPAWERLEIVRRNAGTKTDSEGQVEFIAHFRSDTGAGRLHESSRFVREQGQWLYLDGVQPTTIADKPGRNTACPCGSGRKFKHCCGR